MDRGSLIPYEGSNLQAFNGTTNCLCCYVELMVYVEEDRDLWFIKTQFMVIPVRAFYSCILGRAFFAVLDVVPSPVHLKLKYHNLHEESAVLCTNLEAAKKIHHVLLRDQEKGTTKEINKTSLIW